jgi:phage terminase large subunit-like protein
MPPTWSTACPDWERRIIAGESLVPCPPLFPEEAEEALRVFKLLPIVDQPSIPDGYGGMRLPTFGDLCRPWVFDFVRAIFGAYNPSTGERLITEFFELIPKKNIKSTMAAGIMVTALIRNWRLNQELTILAPTIKIAKNSADPAMAMVQRDPELLEMLRPVEHHRLIQHRTTKAELKILASDTETVGGSKAGFILFEEWWLFGKMANAETMQREATGGLLSRPEGFVIKLTTMSDQPPAGVFKADLERFRNIRDGKIEAPRAMGILYEFPKSMIESRAYERPENFHITNPNYGASVGEAVLLDELEKARSKGAASIADFYAKHLNIEIGQNLRANRWPGAEHWQKRADPDLTREELLKRSEAVVVGIDGGGLDDLFGLNILGREKSSIPIDNTDPVQAILQRKWLSWSHAWCHNGVLERRQTIATQLRDFEKAGDLTIVDDELQDISSILEIIREINEKGLLACVALDPAGIGEFVEALAGIGITQEGKQVVGVPQGYAMMNAIKTAERKLANGTLIHSVNACMDWAVSNLKIEPTATAIRATKQNAGDAKIDPAMSLFDAVYVMQTNPETRASVYEEREMIVL